MKQYTRLESFLVNIGKTNKNTRVHIREYYTETEPEYVDYSENLDCFVNFYEEGQQHILYDDYSDLKKCLIMDSYHLKTENIYYLTVAQPNMVEWFKKNYQNN